MCDNKIGKSALKVLVHREMVAVEAIRNVFSRIKPDEMVGYIRPNGAGKSTTIKIMSGIFYPDSSKRCGSNRIALIWIRCLCILSQSAVGESSVPRR